ncbi:MAG: trypsin-like peptidase domain-containing protein [Actinomycetaceae bacterium]|nr:trypsin-like peptidase domain-containing protein [Actinomycetaceae bacterium]
MNNFDSENNTENGVVPQSPHADQHVSHSEPAPSLPGDTSEVPSVNKNFAAPSSEPKVPQEVRERSQESQNWAPESHVQSLQQSQEPQKPQEPGSEYTASTALPQNPPQGQPLRPHMDPLQGQPPRSFVPPPGDSQLFDPAMIPPLNHAPTAPDMPGGPFVPSAMPPRRQKKRGPGWTALVITGIIAALIGGGGALAYTHFMDDKGSVTAVTTAAPLPKVRAGEAPDWVRVAQTVTPAVVAIHVRTVDSEAEGSGVIFDDKGDILTNHHVIAGAQNQGEMLITTGDGKTFKGKVLGTDPTTDLAVVGPQDPPAGLKAAVLGSSNNLLVGQPVAAIGNPLGYSATMTTGVISALDRPVAVQPEDDSASGKEVVTNAIQIDAAVNPGNSGGPLFNASGEVIGINSSIASIPNATGRGGSIGLGFAIPIDLAKNVAKQLLKGGKVHHSQLGVRLENGYAKSEGNYLSGALTVQVLPGSAAEKAGIQKGDLILEIQGHKVASAVALLGYARWYNPGDEVTLKIVRQGKAQEVKVVLGAAD